MFAMPFESRENETVLWEGGRLHKAAALSNYFRPGLAIVRGVIGSDG